MPRIDENVFAMLIKKLSALTILSILCVPIAFGGIKFSKPGNGEPISPNLSPPLPLENFPTTGDFSDPPDHSSDGSVSVQYYKNSRYKANKRQQDRYVLHSNIQIANR